MDRELDVRMEPDRLCPVTYSRGESNKIPGKTRRRPIFPGDTGRAAGASGLGFFLATPAAAVTHCVCARSCPRRVLVLPKGRTVRCEETGVVGDETRGCLCRVARVHLPLLTVILPPAATTLPEGARKSRTPHPSKGGSVGRPGLGSPSNSSETLPRLICGGPQLVTGKN